MDATTAVTRTWKPAECTASRRGACANTRSKVELAAAVGGTHATFPHNTGTVRSCGGGSRLCLYASRLQHVRTSMLWTSGWRAVCVSKRESLSRQERPCSSHSFTAAAIRTFVETLNSAEVEPKKPLASLLEMCTAPPARDDAMEERSERIQPFDRGGDGRSKRTRPAARECVSVEWASRGHRATEAGVGGGTAELTDTAALSAVAAHSERRCIPHVADRSLELFAIWIGLGSQQ